MMRSACLASLLVTSRGAYANEPEPAQQPPASLTLHVEPCSSLRPERVRYIVNLELADVLHGDATQTQRAPARVSVTCLSDGVDVLVDTGAPTPTRLSLTLANVPAEVHDRLVALAIVELVDAVWQGGIRSARVQKPPSPAPDPTPPWQVVAIGSARRFIRDDLTWLGAGAQLAWRQSPHLTWSLDVGAALLVGADRTVELGEVQGRMALATAAAIGTMERGPWRLCLGPAFVAGWVWLRGRPSADLPTVRGRRLNAPWGGPAMRLAAGLALGRWSIVGLSMDVGYATFGAVGTARDTPQATTQGLTVSSTLGVGGRFQ